MILSSSYQSHPTIIDNQRWDPITGGSSAVLKTATDFTTGFANIFVSPITAAHRGDGAGVAALGSAKGIGKMTGSIVRGTLVDVPMGIADGLHQVPRLYGETPRDNGRVSGIGSGFAVAGKVGIYANDFVSVYRKNILPIASASVLV
jgi:sterol 3beta-glucosyltransferase